MFGWGTVFPWSSSQVLHIPRPVPGKSLLWQQAHRQLRAIPYIRKGYTHTHFTYMIIYIIIDVYYILFLFTYIYYIFTLYIYIIYTCYIHIHYSMHQNMYTIYGYSSLSFQHICKNKRDDEHQSFCWWELFEQTYLPRPVTLSALLVLTAAGNLRSVGWWETLKLNPGGLTFMIIGILVGDF